MLLDALSNRLSIESDLAPTTAPTIATASIMLADTKNRFDLVLLDIALPDGNGRDFCATLRSQGLQIPIIMLTGADDEDDVVRGLTAGANDYIAKPFRPNELLARIRTQLRAFDTSEAAVFRIGPYEFQPAQRLLVERQTGKKIPLTDKESGILRLLYQAAGQPVSRTTLLTEVFGYAIEANTHTLQTHIWRLRGKLEHAKPGAQLLVTDNNGYSLNVTAPTEP